MSVWGAPGPPEDPVVLRAGQLTVEVLGAEIRNLCFDRRQIVQSVYVAVRDPNWGTVPSRILAWEVKERPEAFEVRLEVEHVEGAINFVWLGRITGSATGTFTYEFNGRARADFERNRIGLCLLHGLAAAGMPVGLRTTSTDRCTDTVFPRAISPFQPFINVQGFKHEWPDGLSVDIRLTGDEFETEDQRNWTDASFKTYSTPLRLPIPAPVARNETVQQLLEIEVTQKCKPSKAAASLVPDVRIGPNRRCFPTLGVVLQAKRPCLREVECEYLRRLGLGYVRAVLNLSDPGWQKELRSRALDADQLGTQLELEVVTDDPGTARSVAEELKRHRVERVFVFSEKLHVSTSELLAAYQRQIGEISPRTAIGGGSRAHFAEFNRAALPLEYMDTASFPLSPLVHRSDTLSLIENLAAQAPTVASARTITGLLPLVVGPVTLRPRYNPNAQVAPGAVLAAKATHSDADPRQATLVCAAWTLGSLYQLGYAGADAITYFEATGPRGLVSGDSPTDTSTVRPSAVYHVLERIAALKPGFLRDVYVRDPLTTVGLALIGDDEEFVLIANLANRERTIGIAMPYATQASMEVLEGSSVGTARAWRQRPVAQDVTRGELSISLAPCSIGAISRKTARATSYETATN
ncbi:MAG TPA: hypothetical protein VNF24_08030 [Candidatus Acidoferrales bacterium]|nr:hypothetical protein [Candidatus Acidoferrales bacterium]